MEKHSSATVASLLTVWILYVAHAHSDPIIHEPFNNHSCSGNITFNDTTCTVHNGTANCTSPQLPQVVEALPLCVLRFYYKQHYIQNNGESYVDFHKADFSSLRNLQELVLDPFNSSQYFGNYISNPGTPLNSSFFQSLKKLRILRIRFRVIFFYYTPDIFKDLKNIEILDFTRTRRLGLKAFLATLPELGNSRIRKLLLKNSQTLEKRHGRPYMEVFNLTEMLCPLGATLEEADLSFNDVLVIVLNQPEAFCMQKLKSLDLSFNLFVYITSVHSANFGGEAPLLIWGFFFRIERLVFGQQWYSSNEMSIQLWIGDDTTNLGDLNAAKPISSERNILKYLYRYVVTIKNRCHLSWSKLLLCAPTVIPPDTNHYCKFLRCIVNDSQQYDWNLCRQGATNDTAIFMGKVLGKQCNLTECMYGFLFPFLPYLKMLKMNNLNFYHISNTFPDYRNTTALCVYEENGLESLDISSEGILAMIRSFGVMSIRGFQKIKYISAKNNMVSGLDDTFFQDFPLLEEVHLAGTSVSSIGVLSVHYFCKNSQLKVIDLSSTSLSSIHHKAFSHLCHLNSIDLSNNHITDVSLLFCTQNLTLNLRNNSILALSPYMQQQLSRFVTIKLDLTGNPLSCECPYNNFVTWFKQSQSLITFVEVSEYYCSKSVFKYQLLEAPVNKFHRECSNLWYILTVVFGTLGFTVFCTLPILAYRKRWFLRHVLFKLQTYRKGRQGYENLNNHEYDALIVYSSEDIDRLWVHLTLVRELEEKYSFKLCIHHRDFLGGVDIADNIEDAIHKSRKVIAILSPSFLCSRWCITEVNMTNSIDDNKLIFINYQDLSINDDIPTIIRYLLETKTYIQWDENAEAQQLFWKQIVRALYNTGNR